MRVFGLVVLSKRTETEIAFDRLAFKKKTVAHKNISLWTIFSPTHKSETFQGQGG